MDTFQSGLSISLFTFCSKLIESDEDASLDHFPFKSEVGIQTCALKM